MADRVDVTVNMGPELDEEIKDQLEYGDSKSAWIREAIRMRLREEADTAEDAETDDGHQAPAE